MAVNVENILPLVRRPSRYMGGEVNAVCKDWNGVDVRWCLAFPDVYEVGASHIGLDIIYHILNANNWIFADRVFTPWPDMEAVMRERGFLLWGLGTRRAVSEFDILGITLPYELTCSNILTILDLANIPFYARDRDERYPLVIGGGVGAFNPEPVAPFFDAIVLGDGEDVVCKISSVYKEHKDSKTKILNRLADIDGVYVPAMAGKKVTRAIVSDINLSAYPNKPIVPFMQVVHDRVGIEIQRGCSRGCRFCQAGYIYRPIRQRSPSVVTNLARCALASTGHEDLSFLSLSSGDYQSLPDIIKDVGSCDLWTNISLPSLRVETLTSDVISALTQRNSTFNKGGIKGGFTLAPEAGSERLRSVINKGNTEADLLSTIERVFAAGWRLLKLYFMIGLPTETNEDVEAIANLVHKAFDAGRKFRRDITITVSISTFVPKAHTPFQWARQISIAEAIARQDILKNRLRRRGIEVKWHNANMSYLEGVFARGGRELAPVVVNAWKKGARFDAWDDVLKFDIWMEAFREEGIEPQFYLCEREIGKLLPWDHLFVDLDQDFLRREYENAVKGAVTPDCVNSKCSQCGVCDFKEIKNYIIGRDSDLPAPAGGAVGTIPGESTATPASTKKISFTYTKTGLAKWLSHLELMQVFRRAFRRVGLPTKYSEGFHPHMRLCLKRALKVGEESECEEGEVLLSTVCNAEGILKKVVLPDGIKIKTSGIF